MMLLLGNPGQLREHHNAFKKGPEGTSMSPEGMKADTHISWDIASNLRPNFSKTNEAHQLGHRP